MNNVDQEVLVALANNPDGLRRKDMFSRCESAAVEIDVSHAIKRLLSAGMIIEMASRHGNQGAVYGLSAPVDLTTDAEAWNVRSGIYDESVIAQPECNINLPLEALERDILAAFDDAEVSKLVNSAVDSDSIDGDIDSIIKGLVSLKKRFSRPVEVENLNIKIQCLERFAALANDEIAEILDAIAADLKGLSHE